MKKGVKKRGGETEREGDRKRYRKRRRQIK